MALEVMFLGDQCLVTSDFHNTKFQYHPSDCNIRVEVQGIVSFLCLKSSLCQCSPLLKFQYLCPVLSPPSSSCKNKYGNNANKQGAPPNPKDQEQQIYTLERRSTRKLRAMISFCYSKNHMAYFLHLRIQKLNIIPITVTVGGLHVRSRNAI